MENTSAAEAAALKKNRTTLIVIMVIAFISLGASYGLFYLAQSGQSWGTTNNGTFVQPPTSVADIGWQVDDEPTVAKQWWLWIVVDGCDESCQLSVKNMRALHILLNREVDRVRRGYTNLNGMFDEPWRAQYPQMPSIRLAPPSAQGASTTGKSQSGWQGQPGIYIVDPNGNLVLQYPVESNPKLVLEDLKKLLKVSQIG